MRRYSLRTLCALVACIPIALCVASRWRAQATAANRAASELQKAGYELHTGKTKDGIRGLILGRELSTTWDTVVGTVESTPECFLQVGKLHEIRSVQLFGCRIQDRHLTALNGHDQLQELVLCGTEVGNPGLVVLESMPQLRTLVVGRDEMDVDGACEFDGQAVSSILRATSLETLEIDFPVREEDLVGIEQLQLTTFRLLGSQVGERGMRIIGQCRSIKSLTVSIGDDAAWKWVPSLVGLEEIVVRGGTISSAGLLEIGKLDGLESLRLRPDVCEVTATDWSVLRQLNGLRMLNLSGTGIDDSGLEFLKHLPQLEALAVEGTEVTDRSIETIAKLRHLKTLCVGGSRISPEGRLKLEKLLPNLVITTVLGFPEWAINDGM